MSFSAIAISSNSYEKYVMFGNNSVSIRKHFLDASK